MEILGPTRTHHRWLVPALVAAVLSLLSAGLYSGALDNGFIWDDVIVVREQLPYFTGVAAAFFPPEGIPEFSRAYYRPLVILSYQIDRTVSNWRAGEADAAADRRFARAAHRTNIVLNALTTGLVFALALVLARRCGADGQAPPAAAAGALLFAVHPAHVECVAWFVGRADLLSALFLTAAVALQLQRRATGRPALSILAALLALAAMLSKETGLAALVLLPLVELTPAPTRTAHGVQPAPALWLRCAPVLAAGLVYGVLRVVALGGAAQQVRPVAEWSWLAAPAALGWSAVRILWPWPHLPIVDPPPDAGMAVVGVLVLAASTVSVVASTRPSSWRREAFCGAVFAAAAAPALFVGVARLLDVPVADRHLYAPTIGICLAVGFLLARVAAWLAPRAGALVRGALTVAPALAVAAPLGAAAAARTATYRDNLTFWRAASAAAPASGFASLQLGAALQLSGRFGDARAALQRAEQLPLSGELRGRLYTQFGNLAFQQDSFAEAIAAYRRALDFRPGAAGVHFNWGLAELRLAEKEGPAGDWKGHAAEAIRLLDRALRLEPGFVRARFELGKALLRFGQRDRGRRLLEEVLQQAPAGPEAREAAELLRGGPAAPAPR